MTFFSFFLKIKSSDSNRRHSKIPRFRHQVMKLCTLSRAKNVSGFALMLKITSRAGSFHSFLPHIFGNFFPALSQSTQALRTLLACCKSNKWSNQLRIIIIIESNSTIARLKGIIIRKLYLNETFVKGKDEFKICANIDD